MTLQERRTRPRHPATAHPALAHPAVGSDGRPPVRRTDVKVRTPAEERAERREAARRTEVVLRVTLVTMLWLVSVPLLVGWGLTRAGGYHGGTPATLAAALAVLLPFVAAVIATRNRQFVLGGVYVVLTLAMVVPALAIARAGG